MTLFLYAVNNERVFLLLFVFNVCVPNLFQDGAVVTSSKPLADGLAVGEGEADPGDGLGRLDYGSGDASRPGSDSADVSVLHFHFVVFFSTAPLPDLIVSYRNYRHSFYFIFIAIIF